MIETILFNLFWYTMKWALITVLSIGAVIIFLSLFDIGPLIGIPLGIIIPAVVVWYLSK